MPTKKTPKKAPAKKAQTPTPEPEAAPVDPRLQEQIDRRKAGANTLESQADKRRAAAEAAAKG